MKVIHGYWIMALDSYTCKLDTDTCQLHMIHDSQTHDNRTWIITHVSQTVTTPASYTEPGSDT